MSFRDLSGVCEVGQELFVAGRKADKSLHDVVIGLCKCVRRCGADGRSRHGSVVLDEDKIAVIQHGVIISLLNDGRSTRGY